MNLLIKNEFINIEFDKFADLRLNSASMDSYSDVVEYPNRLYKAYEEDHVLITRMECLRMLYIDYCERKYQKWDIINNLDQIEEYYEFMETNQFKLMAENSITLIPGQIIRRRKPVNKYNDTIKCLQKNLILTTILESPNIILAGGALVNSYCTNDYDLFFIGLETKEQLTECLCAAIDRIAKKFPDELITIQRSIHVINLNMHNMYGPSKFQFILRLYPTAAHVIGGFDIPICGQYFDGETINMTQMAAWQYKHVTIIVDVTRQSPSYKYRLGKYMARGFNVILVGCNCPTKTFPPERKQALREIFSLDTKYDDNIQDMVPPFYESIEIANRYDLQFSYIWLDIYYGRNTCNTWREIFTSRNDLYTNIATHTGVLQKHGQLGFNAGPFKIYQTSIDASRIKNTYGSTEFRGRIVNGKKVTDYVDNYEYYYETGTKYYNNHLMRKEQFEKMMSEVSDVGVRILKLFKADLLHPNIPISTGCVPQKAIKYLTGLNPITTNPGAQWTSSTQPDEETGVNFYQGDWNGCAYPLPTDVTATLVLAWKSGNTTFSILPKDVFKLILWYDFMQI